MPTFTSTDCVKTVQSNAGENRVLDYVSWFEALGYMKSEIESKELDVALIAAAACGIPLAAYIKDLGKESYTYGSNLQDLLEFRG